jgi:hypothetical protein
MKFFTVLCLSLVSTALCALPSEGGGVWKAPAGVDAVP